MLRELAKKTGTYAIAGIAGRAVSILLLPVYTRFLSPADYGVMELLDLTVNLVSLLLGARLGQAIFYFYFAAEGEREKEKCVSTALACSVLCGILCATLSLVLAPPLSRLIFGTAQYSHYLRLVFLGFGLSLPAEVGYCCLRAYGDSKRFAVVKLVSQLGAAILAVTFLSFFHAGINAMLAAGIIGFAAAGAYVSWHLLRPMRLSIDPRLMMRLVRYSMPLGVSALAVFLVHYGDRFFLRPRISLAELGVYSLAYKIGMLVSFCHAPFVLHWNAQ
ncbi:MAG TPA: oligosaccharide flippase family protein, partial [Bryobacteraceae bacterium]